MQRTEDMRGLKHLVRDFYNQFRQPHMPEEFQEHFVEPDEADEDIKANIRLAITHLGVREDDPQHYDSNNAGPSETLGSESESELSARVSNFPTVKDSDKCYPATSYSSTLFTRDQFISTAANSICEGLLQHTGTLDLCRFTIHGIVNCLPMS